MFHSNYGIYIGAFESLGSDLTTAASRRVAKVSSDNI